MTINAYIGEDCDLYGSCQEVAKLWKKSWENNWWHAKIWTTQEAQRFPGYSEFATKVSSFPSVNPRGFDFHAFIRWFVMSHVGGWSSEPDVINYSLRHFVPAIIDKVQVFCSTPCLTYGTAQAYSIIRDAIINYQIRNDDADNGRPHFSDQEFLAHRAPHLVDFMPVNPIVKNFGDDGWMASQCVHFGTGWMARHAALPKHDGINRLRPVP